MGILGVFQYLLQYNCHTEVRDSHNILTLREKTKLKKWAEFYVLFAQRWSHRWPLRPRWSSEEMKQAHNHRRSQRQHWPALLNLRLMLSPNYCRFKTGNHRPEGDLWLGARRPPERRLAVRSNAHRWNLWLLEQRKNNKIVRKKNGK